MKKICKWVACALLCFIVVSFIVAHMWYLSRRSAIGVENATDTPLMAVRLTVSYHVWSASGHGNVKVTMSRFVDVLGPSENEYVVPPERAEPHLDALEFTYDGQAFVYEPPFPVYAGWYETLVLSVKKDGVVEVYNEREPGRPSHPESVARPHPVPSEN